MLLLFRNLTAHNDLLKLGMCAEIAAPSFLDLGGDICQGK